VGIPFWIIPCKDHGSPSGRKRTAIETLRASTEAFQGILERKESELARILRNRGDIAIEKSADQIDEIQHATEREMAIRNLHRESNLLREVKAALRRIHDGSFGNCLQCDEAISAKRLAAVPWAPCCIPCQEAADRNRQEGTEASSESLVDAA
jgi:DnaK suppressor protein